LPAHAQKSGIIKHNSYLGHDTPNWLVLSPCWNSHPADTDWQLIWLCQT